nr:hypothetical protein [Mycobacterium sp. OAS707]
MDPTSTVGTPGTWQRPGVLSGRRSQPGESHRHPAATGTPTLTVVLRINGDIIEPLWSKFATSRASRVTIGGVVSGRLRPAGQDRS